MQITVGTVIRWAILGLSLGASACDDGGETTPSVNRGEAKPLVELPLAEVGPQTRSKQLDLLFVVDNSA